MHEYLKKIVEANEKVKFQPGKVTHVQVTHDKWCKIFNGGECNCNPDISMIPNPIPKKTQEPGKN